MNKLKINLLYPWSPSYKKIQQLHNIAYKLYKKRFNLLSKIINRRITNKYNCYIARGAKIGNNLILPHPTGIVIGTGVTIGDNVRIYQNVTLGRKNKDKDEYPTIGNNVIIYCNSTIIGNVKIGNNAIIGCNSVVLRDVKDNEKVVGIVK